MSAPLCRGCLRMEVLEATRKKIGGLEGVDELHAEARKATLDVTEAQLHLP